MIEVEVVTLNLGDGGWVLCQYIRLRVQQLLTRFELKLQPWLWELVVKGCMRHTFVGIVIIMWSYMYNQNIRRLAYPGTKPIVTAWLTDFGSKLIEIDTYALPRVTLSLRTRTAQTSQRIRAVWSAPLLIAYWKVSYLDVLQAKI